MRCAAFVMVLVSLAPGAWSRRLPEDTNEITMLTPEQAREVVDHDGAILTLPGLTTVSPAVAQALATNRSCLLSLDGLTELSDEAAEALTTGANGLSLERVDRLSVRSAHALARRGDTLTNGITEMNPEVAQELAKHAGSIDQRRFAASADR